MLLVPIWILRSFTYKKPLWSVKKNIITLRYSSILLQKFPTYSFSSQLQLLKCYKKNFYVIQNIFSFNQNKFVFNKIYLHDIKIYFYSIKINSYSMKYIYIKIYFHLNKINLYSKRNIFFQPIKILFYYMNFSFDNFLTAISGLSFSFAKVRIFLSVYKLNSSSML